MNKKMIAGIVLVFISGMFYVRLVASFLAVFGGGMIRDYDGNLVVPPPEFFGNGFLSALYGIPFLIFGIYLIKKSC